MIILRDIDTLRDGGSIVMKLWMTASDLQKFEMKQAADGYVTVMIDYAAKTTTPGVWYNGIKYAGSKKIDCQEFKDSVLKELEKKIEKEQFYLHKLMNDHVSVSNKQ